MAQNLGTAILELAANTARFTSDLGRALSAAEKFKRDTDRAFRTIGVTLTVGAFAAFIKHSIDAADRLNDLRTRTGLTGQQLLVMEGAALRSGVQLDAVSNVASKLSRRLQEASGGTGDAANAFAAMGIKVTDSSGRLKNIDVILKEVGTRFRTYEDGAGKAAIATAALGKGGDTLIPFVEALEETEARFKKLGITIDEDVLTAADEFNDKVEDLKSVTAALGKGIASNLLPHLSAGASALLEFQKNAELVRIAIDAFVIPIKIAATWFIGFVGTVAAASRMLVTFHAVASKLQTLDFAGAWDEFTIGLSETKALLESTGNAAAKLWEKYEAGAKKVKPLREDAPNIPDAAKAKAANDALQKLLDARAKLEIDAIKDSAEKQLQILDKEHAQNIHSIREYWTKRLETQRVGIAAEIGTLDTQIARQSEAVRKTVAGTKERRDAERELEETLAKRAKLERDAGHIGVIASYDAIDALQSYHDSVVNLNAEMLDLQGNTERALSLRQEVTNRSRRRTFMAESDQGALQQLNNIERAERAQARFNDAREEQELIGARLQIQEERIQNALRTGAISELDALLRTGDARRRAADQMESFVRAAEETAKENPTLTKMQLQAEQLRASLERLRSESDLLAEKFNTVVSDAFGDAFADFITSTKSAKDAFNSFANSVIKNLADMYAKQIATGLFGGGQAGGGIGGFLAQAFRGMFSSSPTPVSSDYSLSSGSSSIGLKIPSSALVGGAAGYARGVDFVPRTGLALVHEGETISRGGQSGDVKIYNTYNIEAGADRAQIISYIDRKDQQTIAQIADMTRRGGGFSKAVRG